MADNDTGSTNTTQAQQSGEQTPEQAVQAQIDTLIGKAIESDKGFVFDAEVLKDVSPEIAHAAKTELRLRNTQKQFTKARQEVSVLSNVNTKYKEQLLSNVSLNLSESESKELKTLKINDPEAWRVKITGYEDRSRTALTTALAQIETEGHKATEIELRTAQVNAFNETTGLKLTDEIIQNDLPPRYLKDVEEGKSTFSEFLDKAAKFLTKDKVILGANGDDPENEPDLTKMAGSNEPSEQATTGDIIHEYKKIKF
jgi:hypothetical protein